MRILHLTPGTGSFHCGSCLRDNALVKSLRNQGHDAVIVPLYLPMVTDSDEANPEAAVRVGGITLYLQQKIPLFRFVPRFVKRWLDDPKRLSMAAERISMTSAKDLGQMTVGSLQGERGRQWHEWKQLVEWIETEAKPDVISLSNSLLMGLAPAMKRRLGVPVVCSLQGEDSFLDTLEQPWRDQAWALMRENAKSVTKFIAPSKFYSDLMQQRLNADASQMSVVLNGLNFDLYHSERREPETPVIGYLARMIHGKGLTTLVDAFIDLAKRDSVPGVRLRIAGAQTPGDLKYVASLHEKLSRANLLSRVTFEPNLRFDEKVTFLHEITLFSVPATYGEAFGLYVAEAQACGVPVVQPRHGAFPEILSATQGGLLVPPDDVKALADGLESLLLDPVKRNQLSSIGKFHARARFSSSRMAERFLNVLENL